MIHLNIFCNQMKNYSSYFDEPQIIIMIQSQLRLFKSMVKGLSVKSTD